jgi:hypothetical protein
MQSLICFFVPNMITAQPAAHAEVPQMGRRFSMTFSITSLDAQSRRRHAEPRAHVQLLSCFSCFVILSMPACV